jgi:hypothetical protein
MNAIFDIEVVDVPHGVSASHRVTEYLEGEGVVDSTEDYTILDLKDLKKLKKAVDSAIDEMEK